MMNIASHNKMESYILHIPKRTLLGIQAIMKRIIFIIQVIMKSIDLVIQFIMIHLHDIDNIENFIS